MCCISLWIHTYGFITVTEGQFGQGQANGWKANYEIVVGWWGLLGFWCRKPIRPPMALIKDECGKWCETNLGITRYLAWCAPSSPTDPNASSPTQLLSSLDIKWSKEFKKETVRGSVTMHVQWDPRHPIYYSVPEQWNKDNKMKHKKKQHKKLPPPKKNEENNLILEANS